MGKSRQLNEDIKSISKLMGYDRGLTSVENSILFEQKQLNEQHLDKITHPKHQTISRRFRLISDHLNLVR